MLKTKCEISAQSILKLGNPLLEQKSDPISTLAEAKEVFLVLDATLSKAQTMYNFTRGSGLSAPQLGILKRAFIVEYEGQRYCVRNPEIVAKSEEMFTSHEGCLSFFDYRGSVERHKRLTIIGLDQNAKAISISAEGDFAAILQHEIDHLDGVLYFHRIKGGFSSLSIKDGMPQFP